MNLGEHIHYGDPIHTCDLFQHTSNKKLISPAAHFDIMYHVHLVQDHLFHVFMGTLWFIMIMSIFLRFHFITNVL